MMPRIGLLSVALLPALVLLAPTSKPRQNTILRVGPNETYKVPSQAIKAAAAGDTIEIDPGLYKGDTCSWSTDNLTIEGLNGVAHVDVTGTTIPNQKGIFAIYANHATIRNMEFSGASVPSANGAGIRHQGLDLTLVNCYFHNNQDGILGAPLQNGTGSVLVENCQFSENGAGDGYSHNIYLGRYAAFTMIGSYSHKANVGHLLKSRAYRNLIEQSQASQNPNIVAYGEEDVANPDDHLYMVNNTVVNDKSYGTLLEIGSGVKHPVEMINDIFAGDITLPSATAATHSHCFTGTVAACKFANPSAFTYFLTAGSPCVDAGVAPGTAQSQNLAPLYQYMYPVGYTARTKDSDQIDQGAFGYAP